MGTEYKSEIRKSSGIIWKIGIRESTNRTYRTETGIKEFWVDKSGTMRQLAGFGIRLLLESKFESDRVNNTGIAYCT